jgi:hypothetical protein
MPEHALENVLDDIGRLAAKDRVSIGELVGTAGATPGAAAMIVPALIVVSPLSGIPLLPTLCGLIISGLALQLLFGRRGLWLPSVLARRHLSGAGLRRATARLREPARWIDRKAHARLRLLTMRPLIVVPLGLSVVCGLSMPFLELVPFSSSILGLSVVAFALSILVRDGVLVLAGGGLMGIAALIPGAVLGLVSAD